MNKRGISYLLLPAAFGNVPKQIKRSNSPLFGPFSVPLSASDPFVWDGLCCRKRVKGQETEKKALRKDENSDISKY